MINRSLNRRTFLTTTTTTLALPFIPLADYAADVDVIIIGAGAAGLSAARYLMHKGISFSLPETKEPNRWSRIDRYTHVWQAVRPGMHFPA
ncbi:MAG: FAD-binding protein [bacterium]|nr:FAD-binding protein [bacterium]